MMNKICLHTLIIYQCS